MNIQIPSLPPTTNHAFIQRGRFRVLAPEARQWKEDVEKIMNALGIESPRGLLSVHLRFHSARWFNKDRSVKKRDVANLEKLCIDAVFKCLGVDDSNIFKLTLEKVVSDKELTEVEIEILAL